MKHKVTGFYSNGSALFVIATGDNEAAADATSRITADSGASSDQLSATMPPAPETGWQEVFVSVPAPPAAQARSDERKDRADQALASARKHYDSDSFRAKPKEPRTEAGTAPAQDYSKLRFGGAK